MGANLRTLRAELEASRVFEHREGRAWLKLGAMFAALAACLVGIAWTGWVGALALVPVAAVLCTSISMCGHEGSHRSWSRSPFRNTIIVYLTFPLFSGLGSLYWRNKHDRLHHGHPNVEGVDPDIKPFPFVSSRGDHQASTRGQRWFQRNFQRWAFWPMSILMATGMRRASIIYLYKQRRSIDAAWCAEVACMLVHYIAWIVVPCLVWGPLTGLVIYASVWGLVGVCLALVFAPAHIGLPVVTGQHHDWLHQLETTRNLELPTAVSFFFIGLDYQVEHHLFPKIPHGNLPRASAITAAWCARNGIPHQSLPYRVALRDAASFIADAWERDAMSPTDLREMIRATI
jgi:fatty acid desaturase